MVWFSECHKLVSFCGPLAVCPLLAWEHARADLQQRSEINLDELMRLSVYGTRDEASGVSAYGSRQWSAQKMGPLPSRKPPNVLPA